MRTHHTRAAIASLLAGVAVLTACGNVNTPTEPLPVAVGESTPAPTATSTAVGEIVVNTSTSGLFEGAGFSVTLDGNRKRIIRDDVTISFPSVSVGDHSLALTALPANCTVEGSNPQRVTVLDGVSSRRVFDVTCSAPGAQSPSPD
ncbi:MAG: hypothetical protein V3U67_04475 [Gemmatimonadota bacterium]